MAFVKFSRGLISSYNNLANKDPDTLYLVYENTNSENGLLYLGNKLISTVVNTSTMSLNDLADISLSGELEDGMLLQYNAHTAGQVGEEGKWEAVSLSEVISNLPGANSNISIEESLENIEDPAEKDIAVIGEQAYIYSDGNWIKLTDSDLTNRVTSLEEQVGNPADETQGIAATGLYKDIADLKNNVYTKEEIAEQIAAVDHLQYKIVSDISDINLTSEERDNTVYLIPKDSSTNDGYDEYFVINNSLEKIGSWDVDLRNYVQSDDNRLLTEDQKKKLDSIGLDENDQAIIQASQVGGLSEAINNGQLIKSVQSGTFNVTEEGELQLSSVPSVDLTGYVQKTVYNAEIGNLSELLNRTSENSSLVEEINSIKRTLIWQELTGNSQNSGN